MINFNLELPTHLFFGKDQHLQISNLIPKNAKVLMTYGGGSIKKNGVYNNVRTALKNHQVTEFGGIEANPDYSTLCKVLKVIQTEKIDFLLAVGRYKILIVSGFIQRRGYLGDSC